MLRKATKWQASYEDLLHFLTRIYSKRLNRLFTTFVRPHLEYGQTIWSPHLKKNIKSIEKFQRRATKSVNGFKNYSYQDRLARLNLPTLAFRRLCNNMIEIYKQGLRQGNYYSNIPSKNKTDYIIECLYHQ